MSTSDRRMRAKEAAKRKARRFYLDVALGAAVERAIRRIERRGAKSVIDSIAEYHGVTIVRILSLERTRDVSEARHHALAVLRWTMGWSYPELASLFGLDHSTVIYGVRRWEKILEDSYAATIATDLPR